MNEDLRASHSPHLQNLLFSLHGYRQRIIRYGSSFDSILSAAHQRSTFTSNELKGYQNERLLLMFRVASSTPYWADKFSYYSININADDGFAELMKLPIVHKSDFLTSPDKLLPSKAVLQAMTRYPLIPSKTSGTTGPPLRFFSTREAEKERLATWWRYWQSNGIQMKMWCLSFVGRASACPKQRKRPFWRYNYTGRQILFSPHLLTKSTAALYLRKMRESRVPWLHGCPSSLELIARYAVDHGLDFPCIRFVSSAYEKLYHHQRLLIERAFNVQVQDHYFQAEGVANFSQFSGFNNYVVDEDYAFVELIPTPHPSHMRIIGTNLVNPAFPLFRYEVGDVALPSASSFSTYGSLKKCLGGIDSFSKIL
jgi:phenylacetate-CoA ligase